jgi:hypothetical protein
VLKDVFLQSSLSLAAGSEVCLAPLPGGWKLGFSFSGSAPVQIQLDLLAPADTLRGAQAWPVPMGMVPTRDPLVTIGSLLSRGSFRMLDHVALSTDENGIWRTDQTWPGDKFQVVEVDETLRLQFENKTFLITYVLPDTPEPVPPAERDGMSPATAYTSFTYPSGGSTKHLLTDEFPRIIVMQAGYYFLADTGWPAGDLGADKILVSSVPNVPAYLTSDVSTTPFGSSSEIEWTFNATLNCYVRQGSNWAQTNNFIVDFENLTNYGDSILTPMRPTMVPNAGAGTLPRCEIVGNEIRYFPDVGKVPSKRLTRVMRGDGLHPHNNPNFRLLAKDVEFWGGSNGFSSNFGTTRPEPNARPDQLFANCAFRFGRESVIRLVGVGYTQLLQCEVTDGLSDGLDGKDSRFVLEDGCTMGYVGLAAGVVRQINQASTMHSNSKIVRVNGEYKFTGGPCIQEAGGDRERTTSLNLGCYLWRSLGSTSPARRFAAIVGTGGVDETKMIFGNCLKQSRYGDTSPVIGNSNPMLMLRVETGAEAWLLRPVHPYEIVNFAPKSFPLVMQLAATIVANNAAVELTIAVDGENLLPYIP